MYISIISQRGLSNPVVTHDQLGNYADRDYRSYYQLLKNKGVNHLIGIGEAISRQQDKFEINKSYAVVGPSGSGKTTFMNLLLGRNNCYTGDIFYNEMDIKEISLDSLFEITSFVEQNVFVFDDSIINNITMYSNVDEELLDEVIEIV